jgi:8-amino-7-oxononanoate synthase
LPGYLRLKKQQAELARLGIGNPYFQAHDGVSGATVHIGGREFLNFAGYNYLGLSGHPEVGVAAKAAIDRYGTSVSRGRCRCTARSSARLPGCSAPKTASPS